MGIKLIPLEEVKNILTSLAVEHESEDSKVWILAEAHGKIDNLPTIDPIAIIDKMIEEQCGAFDKVTIPLLQELKSRLLANSK